MTFVTYPAYEGMTLTEFERAHDRGIPPRSFVPAAPRHPSAPLTERQIVILHIRAKGHEMVAAKREMNKAVDMKEFGRWRHRWSMRRGECADLMRLL